MITIKRYLQKEVIDNNHILYNVNNQWTNNDDCPPEDYDFILSRTQTKYWFTLIDNNTKFIEFDRDDTEWMIQALNAYAIIIMSGTNELQAASTISKLYKNQIEQTVIKHSAKFPTGNWFVRVERVSLKTGIHGAGPYNNLKNIIQSIITSKIGHECISITDDIDRFRVYFFEWKNIRHEFRVFVYENNISAISVQHLLEVDEELIKLTDEELRHNIVEKIVQYFNDNLRDRLKSIVGPNYTMDVAILDDNSVYFIEPNSFGANYAAGSALFHWKYDHDILHSTNSIEFRIVDS